MTIDADGARSHYDTLLARHYVWMAGGMEPNLEKGSRFLADHSLTPKGTGVALDLGAGCGFTAIPLAIAGFQVVAVDFSRQMLDILSRHANSLPVRKVHADIRKTDSWTGLAPELIVCMGDTLTHLPDIGAVRSLVRDCTRELSFGGKIVISCRDYTTEPAGSSVIIPVRRDKDRIFICRLDYGVSRVVATDIIYAREDGRWTRASGSYPKLRIAPDELAAILEATGLSIEEREISGGVITITGNKRL